MSSTNNGAAAGADATTASARRPHWRSRDPAATVVYVVHPAQFRDVVQQLTGAAPTNAAPPSQARRNPPAAPCTTADANAAAALEQRGRDPGGDSSRAKTLREMMEECVAWATDDDCGEGS